MFTVKGYCAGQCLFVEEIAQHALAAFLELKRVQLGAGELQIQIGSMSLTASELCYDVYVNGRWRADLSRSFK